MNDDLPYRVALSQILEIGPVKFNQLLSAFGSAREAWHSKDKELDRFGWGQEITSKVIEKRRRVNVEKEFARCQKLGVKLLVPEDEAYPRLLKEIHDPPFLLYVRGRILPSDEVALTVVGSRRMTSYGRQILENLIPELCAAGLTIVSGLAFGVDFTATRIAYETKGRSISVLGSGVDVITPTANSPLAEKILEEDLGAVVSEFPLGCEAQPFYFPRRDRLLSGLSKGTLVVEAAEKSGSLITPKCALEQGREVLAVPGSIFSLVSIGTNNLIKEGARVVTKASDILEELEVESAGLWAAAAAVLPEGELEVSIAKLLADGEEIQVDDLTRKLGQGSGEVAGTLTVMELKGMVKNIGSGYYRRV